MTKLAVFKIPVAPGNFIYPSAVCDEKDLVLFDCGFPHDLPKIREAAKAEEIDIGRITKIIITHHDYDHIGALAEFKAAYPKVQVMSSAIEADYISGRKKSLRVQLSEERLKLLPNDAEAMRLKQANTAVEHANVDILLQDRETLPLCGGITVIATPGHMPGHTSIYLKEFKTVIAGDALAVEGKKLFINSKYTIDMPRARESLRQLLEYDIDKIICYHGGVYDHDIKESILDILSQTF